MQSDAVPYQQEIIVTVTRKGQLTIPAAARRYLQTDKQRKLALTIDPQGVVRLQVPTYPTLASLAGAAGSLPEQLQGLAWDEIVDIAHEDLAEQPINQGQ
jgi:bifunctional DNA-binding transcriptional regulator/antitoxin component of YhaV-PrlF toxin-antitoxin module